MEWDSRERHGIATVGEAVMWLLLAAVILLVLAAWDSALGQVVR